jgi:hypothetical protein
MRSVTAAPAANSICEQRHQMVYLFLGGWQVPAQNLKYLPLG